MGKSTGYLPKTEAGEWGGGGILENKRAPKRKCLTGKFPYFYTLTGIFLTDSYCNHKARGPCYFPFFPFKFNKRTYYQISSFAPFNTDEKQDFSKEMLLKYQRERKENYNITRLYHKSIQWLTLEFNQLTSEAILL